MNITDVQVNLVHAKDQKLKAFCTVTFNGEFVIRDIKIIDGAKGPFVAMPSRKVMDHCAKCRGKNHLRARYCNNCGCRLDPNRGRRDKGATARLHTDIAHPINSECRDRLQQRIVAAYRDAAEKAHREGSKPIEIDDFEPDYVRDEDLVDDRATRTGDVFSTLSNGDPSGRGPGSADNRDPPKDRGPGHGEAEYLS